MGIFARGVAEQKGINLYERWLQLLDSGSKSKSGPSVSHENIFRVSAAFACMREISQGLAQVPFKLMQEYSDGALTRKRKATSHPLYDVLSAKPNEWQSSFEFMETLGLHASLGNAYAFKNMYRGKVAELIILNPLRVRAEQREDWSIVYHVRGKSGAEAEIDSSLIWHVRGPSWDGFLGMEILNIAREAIGLSMALEESHASLHANGVRPSGVYSVDGSLTDVQQKQLVSWIKREASVANTGNPLVLDRSAKWISTSLTGMDAQHLETRQHQIEEVCRFFGVLPSIIGYTGDKANTYASAEVMEVANKVRNLGRWYRRVQCSADINLLTDEERKSGYYTHFNANALMAVSAKDRAEYFKAALGAGGSPAWMSQDEVRSLDELDPFGGAASQLPIATNKPGSAGVPPA